MDLRRRAIAFAILLGSGALGSATASAQARSYRGAHPVDLEGTWHLDGSVHVHDTLPVGLAPFGDADGLLVFLGDPAAYGFTGPTWTYDGAHPIAGVAAYCGLSGRHDHPFAPEGAYRRRPDGAHLHVGAMRGGIPLVTPGRAVPPRPVVDPVALAPVGVPVTPGLTPFWFDGCMHRRVVAGDGSFRHVPVDGCRPGLGRLGPRVGGRPVAAPPPRRVDGPPPALEGRYSRVRSVPAVPAARPRTAIQR